MDDPIQRFKHLLSYIEVHVTEVITLDVLALESGFSRFQLIRLFKKLCGYPPAEYILRRKLSKSISDLYAGRRIIDVSLDYGFEYEQSYIRAFRSVYGLSPLQLKKNRQEVTLFEPVTLGDMKVYSDRFITEPQIKYLSSITFAGEEKDYNYKDNNVRGQPLTDGISRLESGIFTGICIPQGRGTFSHKYIRCIENNPDNHTTYRLPDGKYAVFSYTGFHRLDEAGAHMLRTLMYIVIGAWAAKNHVVWDENFIEQVDMESLQEDYCEVQIMIPYKSRHCGA